jgi:hypothetical protein
MSKRKPPSQRSERKLDETARAIARSREEAKPEKPVETSQFHSENRAKSGALETGAAVKKVQMKTPAAKRQKKV